MRATSQALFMAGVLVGSLAFGKLSDAWGRKKTFFLSVVLQVQATKIQNIDVSIEPISGFLCHLCFQNV